MTPHADVTPPLGWTTVGRGTFIRPLVGSEAVSGAMTMEGDGDTEFTIGISFRMADANQDLPEAFVTALMRLRLIAPLVAADIAQRPEHAGAWCWVYTAFADPAELRAWAQATLTVHTAPPPDAAFVAATTQTRPRCTPLRGRTQHFAAHLLLRPAGDSAFFVHGTHALLDARVAMCILRAVCDFVSRPAAHGSLDILQWGAEVPRLPVALLDALGADAAAPPDGALDFSLPDGLQSDEPGLGLPPQRDTLARPGRPQLVHRALDRATSAALLGALRARALSLPHAVGAALALATFARNAPLAPGAHVTLDFNLVDLTRFLDPAHATAATHFTSCLTIVPLIVPYRLLPPSSTPGVRLLAAARLIRGQYAAWRAHPGLPRLLAVPHAPLPVRAHAHAPFATHVGALEKVVPRRWPLGAQGPVGAEGSGGSEGRAVRMEAAGPLLGFRYTEAFQRIGTHTWTADGCVHFQAQAPDSYDREYVERFLDDVVALVVQVVDRSEEASHL